MANRATKHEDPQQGAVSTDPAPQPAQVAATGDVAGTAVLEIPAALTVSDLATIMHVDVVELIKVFMRQGHMYTINEVVEHDTAALIAQSLGYQVQPLADQNIGPASLVVSTKEEDQEALEPRPPVVTILGHVDHGKTTLLDTIRKANVAAAESGGITQHIGAYQVEHDGNLITFIDTPGHEAFTAMRARGAQVTDVAILVVAADDGIMPQTEEAIDHVKAAGVPIIVAINKIDKPNADQEKVKRQLSEHELLIEEWGGDVIAAPVSALAGDGVDDLLANIQVVAEVNELKANPNRSVQAVVIEARLDKSKGPVTTVLVQTGTLRIGDNVVAGERHGRVRAMFNDRGQRIKEAGPSQPVEVLGLGDIPQAGDLLYAVPDEKTAKKMVEDRERQRRHELSARGGVTLEDVHSRMESGEVKSLNLIVKTDVQGSVDAVRSALEGLNTDQTRVNLVHIATASITESDVMLAVASNAIVIGFNTKPEPGALAMANQESVEIRFYDVIYALTEDIEKALEGLLEPVQQDIVEGVATVRAIFGLGRRTRAAGFYVNDGHITRNSIIHVLRNGESLYVGTVVSLKHFKDDVREVTNGFEGGLVLEGYQGYEEGDVLEAHRIE